MQRCERRGFTLIELLVVIAIIAILAAILFPIFNAARRSSQGTTCMSNLRQISMAVRTYNENWDLRYAPAAGWGYSGMIWPQECFPWLLKNYVRKQEVFYCPTAPHLKDTDFWTWSGALGRKRIDNTQMDPNAPDCGWEWTGGHGGRSNYGNNIALGGMDPATGSWGPKVPTESDVPEPTKVIYATDSRWVDLYGSMSPGRIGSAKERHHGGANMVLCDGHCKWIPVAQANKIMTRDSNPRWDYRR